MANQTGIQQLLAAEKRAADKLADARRRKARRLKQAKDEGEEEIDNFRRESDLKFREFLKKHAGSRENVEANMEVDTKRKIEEVNIATLNQKEQVNQAILLLIEDIKPIIHRNYRPDTSLKV